MSRFTWALCVFVLASAPVGALANLPTFERADALRYAINSVIGDASFVERYGTLPPPGTDPDLRVRTHLAFVHSLLSRRDTCAMPRELRDAREQNLARLHEYIDAGVFPRNERFSDQNRPCFIDDDGRICAVGYLVEQSAGRDAAERINAKCQHEFLSEMVLPELERWIATSGFSRLELALIQPGYPPRFYVTVTQTSATTVKLDGSLRDYGCCCAFEFVSIDFGDAVWTHKATESVFYVPINVEHTYSQPGAYTIVCTAVTEKWCGSEVFTKTWLVTLGTPALELIAVQTGGGPPYGVYLQTTNEIDLACLTSSIVRWSGDVLPQPTTWYNDNGVYRTPVREYMTTGVRTITVSNSYQDDCAANQSGSVTVNVNGNVTPVQVSTWGRIKALYR